MTHTQAKGTTHMSAAESPTVSEAVQRGMVLEGVFAPAAEGITFGLPWLHLGHGMEVCVTELSPELAKRLLSHNTKNRKVKKHRVSDYANDIRSGRWKLNGEAIIVDRTGRLQNGQHRCLAVLDADASILTVMVRVPDGTAMPTLDQGAARNLADALTLGDAETNRGPTVRLIYAHLMGVKITTGGSIRMTGPEAIEVAANLPDVAESVRAGQRVYRQIRGSESVYGALHYLTTKSPIDNSEFFDRLSDGIIGDPRSPVLHLRNRIVSSRGATEVLRQHVLWPLVVKAWNAWAEGRGLGVLRFGSAEQWPEIYGLPDEWAFGAWKRS